MGRNQCNDRVIGAILASWRYDISGISPEMRRDYEGHLAECPRCTARQRFHRGVDVSLFVLTALSVFFSIFALAVLMHIKPLEHVAFNLLGLDKFDMYHMLVSAAIAGVCFSVIAFALVVMATPAPTYLSGIAAERAKLLAALLQGVKQGYQHARPRSADWMAQCDGAAVYQLIFSGRLRDTELSLDLRTETTVDPLDVHIEALNSVPLSGSMRS